MLKIEVRSVNHQLAIAALLVALIVVARLLPHPPNFAPVMAVAIFAAFVLPSVRLSAGVVLLGLLLSDVVVGTYTLGVMASVYLMSVAALWFGRHARTGNAPGAWVLGGSIASAVAFYVVTNAAVWAFTPYYEAGATGLVASWIAGLPFLKWTLAGNLVWTVALFSTGAAYVRLAPRAPTFAR